MAPRIRTLSQDFLCAIPLAGKIFPTSAIQYTLMLRCKAFKEKRSVVDLVSIEERVGRRRCLARYLQIQEGLLQQERSFLSSIQ